MWVKTFIYSGFWKSIFFTHWTTYTAFRVGTQYFASAVRTASLTDFWHKYRRTYIKCSRGIVFSHAEDAELRRVLTVRKEGSLAETPSGWNIRAKQSMSLRNLFYQDYVLHSLCVTLRTPREKYKSARHPSQFFWHKYRRTYIKFSRGIVFSHAEDAELHRELLYYPIEKRASEG